MKSCRNCERSVHEGYFHARLMCSAKSMVVVPFQSKVAEENKTYDKQAQMYAATCEYYEEETQ